MEQLGAITYVPTTRPIWLANPSKSPYQCTGIKSAVQLVPWLAQLSKNFSNHVNPDGAPVTAGAPTLMPIFLNGSTSLIHAVAAALGSMFEPPVLEVPSGSLNVITWEILRPPLTSAWISEMKELLGRPHNIGTNSKAD
jgi:hypothetical protein